MDIYTEFSVQNYLITPAAYAVHQALPQSLDDQKWHLILSGVAVANLKCHSNNDWSYDTLQLLPDIRTPIQYAINNYSVQIPTHPNYTDGGFGNIEYIFSVEQYTIVAGLSAIFDKDNAVNAGFSVNSWRPAPFRSLGGENGAPELPRIFNGIEIDVAVRDSDAYLNKVSFQINLLGKIAFAKTHLIEV